MDPMSVRGRIRPFRPSDLKAVLALIRRTIAISYADCYPASARRFFRKWHPPRSILKDAAAGTVVVLEHNGRIVATGTLVGDEVGRVFVEPDLQHRGLGRRIMARLEQRAIQLGLKRLELHASLPARAFYDSLGYRCKDIGALEMPDGQRLCYYRMTRNLGRQQ